MFLLYNQTNRARKIARDLNVPRYYPYEGRLVTPPNARNMTHLINWGCVRFKNVDELPILNADLRVAASKIATFEALDRAGVACPAWTRLDDTAQSWDTPFLGRRDGLSGGNGIHIYKGGDRPAAHAFYTQLIPCRREYRIHVFGGKVIAIQKKLLADATSVIHNHRNGVIFQHIPSADFDIGRQTTHDIQQMAIEATAAVGLHFGAVDIIQERKTDNLFVLEVNTAPGIRTDQIYAAYLEAFRPYVAER